MTSQTFKRVLLSFFFIPLIASAAEKTFGIADSLTVGSYNVENLFENSVFDPSAYPFDFLPNQRLLEPKKSIQNLKGVALAIKESGYDILVVEEIENIGAMQKLNQYYLNNKYDSYLIEGNDPRGIDVGFFVKKSLPFQIEQRTNKKEMWEDPLNDNKKHTLFSRDLPELHVKYGLSTDPLFILLGTHFKSKIDRPKDKQSKILRQAQVERTAEIIKRLEKEFGSSANIMLSGDFNGDVNQEAEFVALQNTSPMEDAFDIVKPALSKKDRITYTYFPKNKPSEKNQIDAFLVNKNMAGAVSSGLVYRYKDANGKTKPIPNSNEEKKQNPSDHFPVVVKLEMSKLVH